VEKELELIEETIAMLIADRIAGLDKEVFLENPIKKIIEQERQKRVILLSKSGKSEDFTKMTLEEVFIGIAAHEVRHRVQHLLPIEWFLAEHAKTIDAPYFRSLM